MPYPRSRFVFPNSWATDRPGFDVAVLEKYNIAVANVVPDSLTSVNFPLTAPPPAYSDDVFDAFVDQYEAAIGKVADTVIGGDLLDVIAKGKPLDRTLDNQWAYQAEDGSLSLSDTQAVIFPATGTVDTETPLRVQKIDPDSGSATSIIYDLDSVDSQLDSQGRLFINDPMSMFFHELVHVPQDVFDLTPTEQYVMQLSGAKLPVFGGQLGDGQYPRQVIEEFRTLVPAMETLTHGGQVAVVEMRESLIDGGQITADEYRNIRRNPYAKRALDVAKAGGASAEQIHARWLYYTTNPTEIKFADETGAIVRESYMRGIFDYESDSPFSTLPRFVLNDGVSIFDIGNSDLLNPDSSARLRRFDPEASRPMALGFRAKSMEPRGPERSSPRNMLAYDYPQIRQARHELSKIGDEAQLMRNELSRSREQLSQSLEGESGRAAQEVLTQLEQATDDTIASVQKLERSLGTATESIEAIDSQVANTLRSI